MKAKTRKSLLKRFKITKSGKVLHRPIGQDHYLAKKSSKIKRKKRKLVPLSPSLAKKVKKFLYYSGKRG